MEIHQVFALFSQVKFDFKNEHNYQKKSVLKRLQLHEKLLDPCHSSVYCFCCQDVYLVQSLFLLI